MNELVTKALVIIKGFKKDCIIENLYLGPKEEQLAKSLQSAVNCFERRNGDKLALSELIKRLSQAELYVKEQEKKRKVI
jgi:hypothetical protein